MRDRQPVDAYYAAYYSSHKDLRERVEVLFDQEQMSSVTVDDGIIRFFARLDVIKKINPSVNKAYGSNEISLYSGCLAAGKAEPAIASFTTNFHSSDSSESKQSALFWFYAEALLTGDIQIVEKVWGCISNILSNDDNLYSPLRDLTRSELVRFAVASGNKELFDKIVNDIKDVEDADDELRLTDKTANKTVSLLHYAVISGDHRLFEDLMTLKVNGVTHPEFYLIDEHRVPGEFINMQPLSLLVNILPFPHILTSFLGAKCYDEYLNNDILKYLNILLKKCNKVGGDGQSLQMLKSFFEIMSSPDVTWTRTREYMLKSFFEMKDTSLFPRELFAPLLQLSIGVKCFDDFIVFYNKILDHRFENLINSSCSDQEAQQIIIRTLLVLAPKLDNTLNKETMEQIYKLVSQVITELAAKEKRDTPQRSAGIFCIRQRRQRRGSQSLLQQLVEITAQSKDAPLKGLVQLAKAVEESKQSEIGSAVAETFKQFADSIGLSELGHDAAALIARPESQFSMI